MKHRNLADHILEELKSGPRKSTVLIESLQRIRPGTTKQAVYAALRNLRLEEKITVHGKHVSLSRIWVAKMAKFFSNASRSYTAMAISDDGFLNLEPGDRIVYNFKNPITADVFWAHAFDLLAEITPKHTPIHIWNPHEWFFLAHHESERALFDRVIESGKQIFLMCGNKDPLDRYIAKEFDGERAQYYMTNEKIFPRSNYYVNVFGTYILEVFIDEKTANAIDIFYKTTPLWNLVAQEKLQKIFIEHTKTRITISNNERRAEKIKRQITKPFYKLNISKANT